MTRFNHFDDNGNAVMVDVSKKDITERIAVASGKIKVNDAVMEAIINKTAKKGDVLGVARIAGIMGAKQTANLIPMCHPLCLNKCTIDFKVYSEENIIEALCTVKVSGKTGVEMEALTGVNTALLTIYDMCKAIDRGMELFDIHLDKKDGGKSGVYRNHKMLPIIAVSGIKNSGKTKFIENILPLLIIKGIKVAVIKHDSHSFDSDVEGTDTFRLREAGASVTAIYCDSHYMIINNKPISVEKLIKEFLDVDLIICEGLKNSDYKKFEIVRQCNSEDCVCDKNTIIAVVTDIEKDFDLPHIGLNDYQKAVELILEYITEETVS